MNKPFPPIMTIGEKYGPAMRIVGRAEAEEYFERCVQHSMRDGLDRAAAEALERTNIGYFAGYCNVETQKRVEVLFGAVHPFFGAVGNPNEPKTAAEAVEIGRRLGEHTQKGDGS